MAVIEVKNLSKIFTIKEKKQGFKGSIQSIFHPKYRKVKSVKKVNFSVDKG